jgi:hypothetical protein
MELTKPLLLPTAFSFSGCPAGTVAYRQGTAFAMPQLRIRVSPSGYHSSFKRVRLKQFPYKFLPKFLRNQTPLV